MSCMKNRTNFKQLIFYAKQHFGIQPFSLFSFHINCIKISFIHFQRNRHFLCWLYDIHRLCWKIVLKNNVKISCRHATLTCLMLMVANKKIKWKIWVPSKMTIKYELRGRKMLFIWLIIPLNGPVWCEKKTTKAFITTEQI